MTYDVSTWISIAAIFVMLYCLFLVITLGNNVPGGVVGKQWKFLTSLVVLFTIGYLVTPLLWLAANSTGQRNGLPDIFLWCDLCGNNGQTYLSHH